MKLGEVIQNYLNEHDISFRSANLPHALCHCKDPICLLAIMEPPHLRESHPDTFLSHGTESVNPISE